MMPTDHAMRKVTETYPERALFLALPCPILSPSGSTPLGGSFYELIAQGGEVECGVERVGERHPVEHRPRVEILTQDYGHLPQTGDRPDLGVVVGEPVLPDAPQVFEHHGPVTGKTGKASMSRSTSRRTVVGFGRGSSFLRQTLANSERTCAGSAAVPEPPTRRSTSLARSRFSGSLRSRV
jgi:hypothetical protein